MQINFDRFPGGKTKALTMSYDDGVRQDVRLIEIFNRYGIKGTFHINGGSFGADEKAYRLSEGEIIKTYAGHEISCHGFTHQSLTVTPNERIATEVMLDRQKLESLVGAPVRGMSYAYGSVNNKVVEILGNLGIEYSRTTIPTNNFGLPNDFLQWNSTCHHKGQILDLADKFLNETKRAPLLFYVWGHSYEFDNDNNWELIEEFCKKVGGKNDIWYATNIEICDYIKTVRNLKFSMNQEYVLNQSAADVWISVGGKPVKIKGGATVKIQ